MYTYVCVYIYIYIIYMYMCVYKYIYIYIYIYTCRGLRERASPTWAWWSDISINDCNIQYYNILYDFSFFGGFGGVG